MEPEKLKKRQQKEKDREEKNAMIEVATSEILNANRPITSCDQVRKIVEREQKVELSIHDV